MRLDRNGSPVTIRAVRSTPSEYQAELARGEAGERWRLWMLVISFGFIIAAIIVTAAVGS
jgi:hypothetical protein